MALLELLAPPLPPCAADVDVEVVVVEPVVAAEVSSSPPQPVLVATAL